MFFALRMQELLDLINFTTRAVFPAQLYTTAACSAGAFVSLHYLYVFLFMAEHINMVTIMMGMMNTAVYSCSQCRVHSDL